MITFNLLAQKVAQKSGFQFLIYLPILLLFHIDQIQCVMNKQSILRSISRILSTVYNTKMLIKHITRIVHIRTGIVMQIAIKDFPT